MSSARVVPYVVRTGDFLGRIAHRVGVSEEAIWQHPGNASLRERRNDPNQLVAGDLLYVPESPATGIPCVHGQENRYRANVRRVVVSVELHDDDGSPLRLIDYRIVGVGLDVRGTTNGEGILRCEVPVETHSVTVSLPALDRSIELWIGQLDPIDTESGARQRLVNLGHLHPAPGEAEDEVIASAVRCFQRAEHIAVTGVLDAPTRAALAACYTRRG
jgi:hypothetical protein